MGCGPSKGSEGEPQAAQTTKQSTPAGGVSERPTPVKAFVAPKAALQNFADDATFDAEEPDTNSSPEPKDTIAAKHGTTTNARGKGADEEFEYNVAAPAGRAAPPAAGGLLTNNAAWLEQERKEQQEQATFSNETPAASTDGALFMRPTGSLPPLGSLPALSNNLNTAEMRRRSSIALSSQGVLHAQPLLHEPEPEQEHDPNAVFEPEPEEPETREDCRQEATGARLQQQQQQYGSDCDSNEQPDDAAGSHDEQEPNRSASCSPTPAPQHLDPSDPWSALQSQYQIRHTPSGAPAAASMRLPGSTAVGRVTQEELVLVDEGDDDDHSPGAHRAAAGAAASTQRVALRAIPSAESSRSLLGNGSHSHRGQHAAGGLTGGASFRAGTRNASPAPAPAMKQGGWGQGQLAAPGTLMLGAQGRPQPCQKDGVFDDSDEDASSNVRYGGHEVADDGAAGMPGAVFEDGTYEEDVEDVDALLAEQDAHANALPGDLASKLARFEAMAGGNDDD